MSFTPGPWKLDVRVGCVAVYPYSHDHNCLSGAGEWAIHYKSGYQVKDENGNFVRWEVPEEVIANARLIAAAPDLLKACEAALNAIDTDVEVVELLCAAIAKAYGISNENVVNDLISRWRSMT